MTAAPFAAALARGGLSQRLLTAAQRIGRQRAFAQQPAQAEGGRGDGRGDQTHAAGRDHARGDNRLLHIRWQGVQQRDVGAAPFTT